MTYLGSESHHDAAIGVRILFSSVVAHALNDPIDRRKGPSIELTSLCISDKPRPRSKHQHYYMCQSLCY